MCVREWAGRDSFKCPEKLEEKEAKPRARRSAERMSGSTRLLFYCMNTAMPLPCPCPYARAQIHAQIAGIKYHTTVHGQGLRTTVSSSATCFPSLLLKKHEITDKGRGRAQSQQRQLADLLAETKN